MPEGQTRTGCRIQQSRHSESRTSLLQGAGSAAPVVPLFPRVHFSAADGRRTKDLPSVLGSQRTLGYSSAWENPPIPSHPNASRDNTSHPNPSHPNTSHPNTSHPNSTQLIPPQHVAPHPTPSKAVALPARPVSGLQRKVAPGKFFGRPSSCRKGREVPGLLRVNCPTSASPHAEDLGVQGLPVPPVPCPGFPGRMRIGDLQGRGALGHPGQAATTTMSFLLGSPQNKAVSLSPVCRAPVPTP